MKLSDEIKKHLHNYYNFMPSKLKIDDIENYYLPKIEQLENENEQLKEDIKKIKNN